MLTDETIVSKPAISWEDVRELSLRPGGFGERRTELWTSLLHASSDNSQHSNELPSEPHDDERQIRLDTDRSFVLYPVEGDNEHVKHQNELHDLIVSVFRKRPTLSYFQGYHDIISVLFLTLPKEMQLVCAEKLSLHRVRDSMGATLEPVVGLLHVFKRVFRLVDPEFSMLLARTSPLPYFALSNLLTLFSHDVPTLPLIRHVFDYLLCRPPILVVYLAVAVTMTRKDEAIALERDGEEGMIHSVLSGLPELFEEDEKTTLGESEEAESDHAPGITDRDIPTPNIDLSTSRDETSHSSASSLSQDSREETILEHSSSVAEGLTEEVHDMLPTSGSESLKAEPSRTTPTSRPCTPPSADQIAPSQSSPQPSRPPTPGPAAPCRPRVSISHLLRTADSLYTTFPPSHPSVALDTIMGPQSVMMTWTENPEDLPEDDEAERIVLRPDLIVLPIQLDEEDTKETYASDGEEEKSGRGSRPEKRRRRKLRKGLPLTIRRKTMVASAVLVLGVAMAVYGTGGFQRGGMERHGAAREWRAIKHFVGAIVVGAAERLLDSVWK
ncbi:rab-GTPase-TBC domain-containing protein [Cristinia sonorae]|uniref:Rab-GTPase-TBC domain-containing protein n=1 Tax=Cristinia sonorae TaxID=1940300 RepID=A0A8K0UFL1_9AGAR|nr:rab-GTPase-TBC domain-containing protein [Cristinia sonorae]